MKTPLKKSQRDARIGFAFFTPALVVLAIGLLYPVIKVLIMSLKTTSGIGLENYVEVFRDKALLQAVWHSLVFTVVSTAAHIILGLLFASMLNFDLNPSFVKIMRSAMIIPWAISPVVVAMIFRILYHPELSVLSTIYKTVPVFARGILTDSGFALLAVIIINIWYATPFYFLLFLARIQSMPKEVFDAAAIDGCNYTKSLAYITFPMLKPLIVTLTLYDVVAALNTFDLIWITTSGGPDGATEVLSTYIYKAAFRNLDFNYAAALGIVLLILIVLACGIVWFLGREKEA